MSLTPSQIAVLAALARQTAPASVTETVALAGDYSRSADTSARALRHAIHTLATSGHVEGMQRKGDPRLYTITRKGRQALTVHQRQAAPRGHFGQGRPPPVPLDNNDHGSDLTSQPPAPSVAGPYRPNIFGSTYTCPELTRPPARGAAAMAAYGLPSRGIG